MLWSVMRFISKTSSVTPDFFTFLILSYHFLPAVKFLKKSVCGKFWAWTSLNPLLKGFFASVICLATDQVSRNVLQKCLPCACSVWCTLKLFLYETFWMRTLVGNPKHRNVWFYGLSLLKRQKSNCVLSWLKCFLTLSLPRAKGVSLWRVKSSGVRQSKIY